MLLLLFFFFKDYSLPEYERIVYQGYDKGTTREIVRDFYVKEDHYRVVQHHLDKTNLTMIVKISKKDFSTYSVYKKTENKEVYNLIKDEKGYIFRLNKGRWKKLKKKVIYDRHTLFEVFRFYPFSSKETIEFPLFEAKYGMVVKGVCKYEGEEVVETPMGKIRCYKIIFSIEKGIIGSIVKTLLKGREFQFFYEKESPHRLVYWTDKKDGYIIIKRIENSLDKE